MATKSLDSSGLKLLKYDSGTDDGQAPSATVFASDVGIRNLRKKVEAFRDKETDKGRPSNADLIQSISAIVRAGLEALWRSPMDRFPTGEGVANWEIWLERENAQNFLERAARLEIAIGTERLEFPEDIVVFAVATPAALACAVRQSAQVRALAAPAITADYFDGLPIEEQIDWLTSVQVRTDLQFSNDSNYITLLDTGISRAHPLLAPALVTEDRHAANPAWGVDDTRGHGTKLAGLALYGDLNPVLQSMQPVILRHRLESVKIIPDTGHNSHELLGIITKAGVNAVETTGERRRTFTMASSTADDTPHDGAPTSWSSEIDQLAAGASGNRREQRLILVSAGNSDQNKFGNQNYLDASDDPDNEIESPAHAWNTICVGGYTEKTILPTGEDGAPIAPYGDLSPNSRTASWERHWPLKPDVVFEAGNWIACNPPPPMRHPALSCLTTDHNFPLRAFATCDQTSAATALAAKAITDLWSEYPTLWPETIRAIFVSSARWTPQMLAHLPNAPVPKSAFSRMFQRYGYGVPDMDRARRSASNALTLIVQDTLVPYRLNAKRNGVINNEMKIFDLPWPRDELRRLLDRNVSMRIALSTFIEPNPSEAMRGSKFRYASHNIRFKLNRANENVDQFAARISKLAEDEPEQLLIQDDDGWQFGENRRSVGSLHIDELSCPASDLAQRNFIAVHPVAGWRKCRNLGDPADYTIRFALVVEIDAGECEAELYTEVKTAIETMNIIEI